MSDSDIDAQICHGCAYPTNPITFRHPSIPPLVHSNPQAIQEELMASNKTGETLKVEESWVSLNALDYATVVLSAMESVAGMAPFGGQLQACIGIAQTILSNVKVRHSL